MGKIAQIHNILGKKLSILLKLFFINFNSLQYDKCMKILSKPLYGRFPFYHSNHKIKIEKPCCCLHNHNCRGWKQRGGDIR